MAILLRESSNECKGRGKGLGEVLEKVLEITLVARKVLNALCTINLPQCFSRLLSQHDAADGGRCW